MLHIYIYTGIYTCNICTHIYIYISLVYIYIHIVMYINKILMSLQYVFIYIYRQYMHKTCRYIHILPYICNSKTQKVIVSNLIQNRTFTSVLPASSSMVAATDPRAIATTGGLLCPLFKGHLIKDSCKMTSEREGIEFESWCFGKQHGTSNGNFEKVVYTRVIKLPIFILGGIKHCKCMLIFGDFPL